jgi:hypothetical protein
MKKDYKYYEEDKQKTGKEILTEELNLTEKEFNLLANYAYCDQFDSKTQSVNEWQQRQLEAMMEEEGMEEECGEPMWEPGDKNKLMNIFYR